MLTFLVSEAAFFSTLVVTYLVFLRQTMKSTPSPSEVFHMPMVIGSTVCLLSSSLTVHLADGAIRRGAVRACIGLWALTIALGCAFLAGTGMEWADLIGKWGLTISRNMFGSAYFTLVGFHALHVSIGLVSMLIVLSLLLRGRVSAANPLPVEVLSWYWHFVDGVWVVVFTVVYIVGR
jgi:cytochrome c oxidase subunit 3/cytochrome o ubiquinol oxidase subunit 3